MAELCTTCGDPLDEPYEGNPVHLWHTNTMEDCMAGPLCNRPPDNYHWSVLSRQSTETKAQAFDIIVGECLDTCDSFSHDEKCPAAYPVETILAMRGALRKIAQRLELTTDEMQRIALDALNETQSHLDSQTPE